MQNTVIDGRPRPGQMGALCSGVALMNAAMAVTGATSTLVAGDHLGTSWASLPNTTAVIGTGLGAALLTRLMRQHGRRAALIAGYLAAGAGTALAIWAVTRHDMAGLSLAMLLIGLGNAGAQLSRYAAADLYPAQRKGLAISIVVWSAALGAVGGPLLLGVSGDLAAAHGLTEISGPFLLSAAVCAAAVLATLTFRTAPAPAEPGPRTRLRVLIARPAARDALLVMITAQVVMVVVMTATPIDMNLHGHGLSAVGLTLSAHTLGMFALSPLTGRLCDHTGPRPVMTAGLLVLTASCLCTALSTGPWTTSASLFLLGYAWNLCFVAGSSLLATTGPATDRTDAEGTADAAIWTTAAAAALISTPLLAHTTYPTLALISAALTLLATAAHLRTRIPNRNHPDTLRARLTHTRYQDWLKSNR